MGEIGGGGGEAPTFPRKSREGQTQFLFFFFFLGVEANFGDGSRLKKFDREHTKNAPSPTPHSSSFCLQYPSCRKNPSVT